MDGYAAMEAKALLEGSLEGHNAATATAMRQALEFAWSMVAPQHATGAAIEKARILLAECILAVTGQAETDVNKIVSLALTMFRQKMAPAAARCNGGLFGWLHPGATNAINRDCHTPRNAH